MRARTDPAQRMQQGLPGFGIAEVHNLFFALFPDAQTGNAIAAANEALRVHGAPQGRWLKPARHHLTLRFLGTFSDVPPDVVARASAAAARVRAQSFTLRLDRFGSFGNRGIPVWLGPSQVPPALRELHASLGNELAREGVRADGATAFVPHLTILRDAADRVDAPCAPPVDWPVAQFALVDSCTQPPTPFRILGRWNLA